MFNCPNCATPLSRAQNQLGVYWYCPGCTGRAVSLAVVRKAVAPEFVTRIWRAACANVGKPGRACPSCSFAMLEVAAPDTQLNFKLDVCKRCYLFWFDPHELESVPPNPEPPMADDKTNGDNLPQAAREALALYEVQRLAEQANQDDEIGLEWRTIPGMFGLPIEAEAPALHRVPWLTWILSVLVFVVGCGVLFAVKDPGKTVETFGFIPAKAFRMLGLTFITSFFLHGGLLHLIGNLYFMLVFGDNVEDYLGRLRFMLLLLCATVAGNLLHMLGDPRSTIPCIGASGGISGLIAFYALAFPHARIGVIYRFILPIRWVYFPAWVGFCVWVFLQSLGVWQQVAGFSNVSALAHLGGAAVGILFWLKYRPS